MSYKQVLSEQCKCHHCWHVHPGPLLMVVPPGMVVMECCHCHATKLEHGEHVLGERPWRSPREESSGHSWFGRGCDKYKLTFMETHPG